MASTKFTIPPHDATGSAARNAIAFNCRALTSQVAAAGRGEVEPVHQLRVAARRLRAAVGLFAPYIIAIKPKDTDARLKWLGAQAGAVRDLDVLEDLLRRHARKLDPLIAKDLTPLFAEIRTRRKKAAQSLATALTSRRYKALIARLSAPIGITARGDAAFGSVAEELFAPMLKSVIRAGHRIHENSSPDDLHRLRKRAKRSRYALELMLSVDPSRLSDVLQGLIGIQDLLGGYHDDVVAIDWIREFINSRELPLNVTFACGALMHAAQRHQEKLRRRGLRQWHRFVKTEPERRVKKALAKVQPKRGSSNDAVRHAPRTRRGSHPQERRRSAQVN